MSTTNESKSNYIYVPQEEVKARLDNQPFYVVEDESYNRMMTKLQEGEKYIKTYSHPCPHMHLGIERAKEECNCHFQLNFLRDGKLIRTNNGVVKPVFSESIFWAAKERMGE